jgi:hypothetical protein
MEDDVEETICIVFGIDAASLELFWPVDWKRLYDSS